MSERFPRLVLDLLLALVIFAVLGLLGAVIWNQVTDPPTFTRTAQGAEMDQLRLTGLFALDGWFAIIAVVLAVAGGFGLLLWRSREPVWIVVVGLLGSGVAAWLMLGVGKQIGPPDPGAVLSHAAVGTTAPVRLALTSHHFLMSVHGHQLISFHAPTVAIAWPLGAVLGMVSVLMFSSGTSASAPAPSPEATAAPGSP